jgi:pimeloyl-ACP methyl ester carboxylesterase
MTCAVALAALLAAGVLVAPYARGLALVIEASGIRGPLPQWSAWGQRAHHVASVTAPSRHGLLRMNLYVPEGRVQRALLLVPGVHAGGIDEPRLVEFSSLLAARGLAVTTVELPDLRAYGITPRSTDMIEDAATWLLARRDLAVDGRIGMVGVSFGGGLTLVAAGRAALRDRVAFALSFGGHGDLPRTLRYLCTGEQPDGLRRPPHDYGVAIILLGLADRLVPAVQVEPLQHAIRTFLAASHVDMVDKPRAATIFQHAVALAGELPEPARTLMGHVNARDVGALGPILLPHVGEMGGAPALSPERSPPAAAPTYLLHGLDDNVIPAVESQRLAEYLAPHTRVRLLLTPLITHAEVDRPSDLPAIWKLVSFWRAVLDE